MRQDPPSPSDDVVLQRCQDPPPVSVVTAVAPVGEHRRHAVVVGWGQVGIDPDDHVALLGEQQTLYVTCSDRLYAINASDGTVRWCQQVKLTQELLKTWSARHERRYGPPPPPPQVTFGTARVAKGVVYVCASGYGDGGYTCAFAAEDGGLLWRTPTDAWRVDIPFADDAVPLVKDGMVYHGTYALREQDGSVLWRSSIDTPWLSLQALVDGTLYAVTQMEIVAIHAHNGEVRWHYEPDLDTFLSGPPLVAGHLLYAGTSGSADHPEQSRCSALDTDTGIPRWQYPLGNSYVGAVSDLESLYVSSRDRHLYALEKRNGSLRWKHTFADPTSHPATVVGQAVYLNNHGASALSSRDGTTLWHKELENGSGCTPSVVVDGVVYLASNDGPWASTLYALSASNGTEYWHKHSPSPFPPLAVVTSHGDSCSIEP